MLKPILILTSKLDPSFISSFFTEVSTARGRLKGALMEVLDPTAEESDASSDYVPDKRDRFVFMIYLFIKIIQTK